MGMNPRRLTDAQERQLVVDYQSGATMTHLADTYECSEGTVKNALRRQGVPTRPRAEVAQSQTCLSPQNTTAAIADYSSMSLEAVALKYGCSAGTVRNILMKAGVPRRHVGPHKKNGVPTSKVCSTCKADLPVMAFHREGKKTSECTECCQTRRRNRYHADGAYRQQRLDAERRRKTGWSSGLFEEMWQRQGGRCAICQEAMEKSGSSSRSVQADHDHTTGKMRALLCAGCNKGLGHFRESIPFMTAAIDYIKKYQ